MGSFEYFLLLIKLDGSAKINDLEGISELLVDQDILRLEVSVHDA